MHEAAVVCLCALVAYFASCDARLLFLSWYSGVDPPLTGLDKAFAGLRIGFALAASIAALATL
ncbi:MAG: hypothetical protein AB8H80_23875 [Planctomycetota bacterium]